MSGSLSDIAEPWGQLVRIECGGDADRFPFSTNEVKIGRSAGKTATKSYLGTVLYLYVFIVYVFHWMYCVCHLESFLTRACVHADCDLSIPSNKYLSSVHCRVLRDEGGRVFLKDTR